MQKQLDSGRFGKPERKAEPESRRENPPRKPTGQQPLYAEQQRTVLELNCEADLGERLLQLNCDIYRGGEYRDYAERLGFAILRDGGVAMAVAGRWNGKPETITQAYERLCGRPLPKPSEVRDHDSVR